MGKTWTHVHFSRPTTFQLERGPVLLKRNKRRACLWAGRSTVTSHKYRSLLTATVRSGQQHKLWGTARRLFLCNGHGDKLQVSASPGSAAAVSFRGNPCFLTPSDRIISSGLISHINTHSSSRQTEWPLIGDKMTPGNPTLIKWLLSSLEGRLRGRCVALRCQLPSPVI